MPIQSISCNVCLPPVHVWYPHFLVDWGLLVKGCIANIGIPLDIFSFFCNSNDFWVLKSLLFFWSLQNSLLCIVGEVAECFFLVTGDRWQMTDDRWHVTHYKWQMTCDTGHLRHETWFFFFPHFSLFWF